MSRSEEPDGSGAPAFDLSEEDVLGLADELIAYHGEFAELFLRREQEQWALIYVEGLLHPDLRKSVEPLALSLEGGNVRPMQRFIGKGAWEDEPILGKHRELVAESLGAADGVLIVDGTDFPKKGRHSVGVARQYCGATGKIDNCQASVFLAYASSRGHTLLDRRLYLPEAWFAEASREHWERCGIPDEVRFRTKPQLAWEMIEAAVASSVLPITWVTCDEAFGNNPEFLGNLERVGLRYLAEVPVSTLVWLECPETEVPLSKAAVVQLPGGGWWRARPRRCEWTNWRRSCRRELGGSVASRTARRGPSRRASPAGAWWRCGASSPAPKCGSCFGGA